MTTQPQLSNITFLDLMVSVTNGSEKEFLNFEKGDEPTAPICELA